MPLFLRLDFDHERPTVSILKIGFNIDLDFGIWIFWISGLMDGRGQNSVSFQK